VARLTWEFIRDFRQRQMLRTMFAGHVSPQVMRALLGGELQLEESGRQQAVTLLVPSAFAASPRLPRARRRRR
jgi:hypothetical protein